MNENGKGNRPTSSTGEDSGTFNDIISAPPCPTLSMVTKHTNGTLNLWQLTFADKSKFSQVLSIGHASRASGHRFRVNDVTCHPVLPLLLTTSHHNLPDQETPVSPLSLNPPIAQPPSVSILYILNKNILKKIQCSTYKSFYRDFVANLYCGELMQLDHFLNLVVFQNLLVSIPFKYLHFQMLLGYQLYFQGTTFFNNCNI